MSEPRPSEQYETNQAAQDARPRAVQVVLSLDWAQAVTHLQQLHNDGYTVVRLLEDDRGRVRIEPDS